MRNVERILKAIQDGIKNIEGVSIIENRKNPNKDEIASNEAEYICFWYEGEKFKSVLFSENTTRERKIKDIRA